MLMAKKVTALVLMTIMVMSMCIGYAALTENMGVSGIADVAPSMPDVYITKVTPSVSSGVTVTNTYGTVFFAEVDAGGTATFTVEVVNISNKTYVFERIIEGSETGFEGAYTGSDIKCTVSNIKMLDEVAPNGGTRTFNVTITVPRGVTTDNYIVIFNFVEKTGTEILPGNDEYDVTFVHNNGQADSKIKVHADELVPRPVEPTRNGYTFIGWYKDMGLTEPWNFEIDTVKYHMTLYAGWEYVGATEYIVTFRPNNGESDRILVVGANELIPVQESPIMEGYTFVGWYSDSAWTKPWNFDTDRVTRNMILYGGWEIYIPPVPPECDITFKPQNGDPDFVIMALTGEFLQRPTAPTRDGYTFTGWYRDEACTNAWNFEVDKVEGNATLYGGWSKNPIIEVTEYTITFQPNNGTSVTTTTVIEGELIPRPPLPTRDGYTFAGWYTDSACTMGWNFDTDKAYSNMTLYGAWKEDNDEPEGLHNDFMGLVEALLSTSNNCMNYNDLIFDAVMESLTSKKRPEEDAPILHCSVNSVSGGTMSAIASFANAKLTADLHFIFEVDPDPAYQETRLRLYMYYGEDCENANDGDEIMVYLQIISRDSNGVWFADGTYIGEATVGDYFGGGNAGKDVKTINPYSWHV